MLELVHAVAEDNHLAAHRLVFQVAQCVLLEVSQVVVFVPIQQLHHEIFAVKF